MTTLEFLKVNTPYCDALCEMTIRMLDHYAKHYHSNWFYYTGAIVKLFADIELLAYVTPITGGLRVTVCNAAMTDEIEFDLYTQIGRAHV